MFSFWSILRIIYSLLFTVMCVYFTQFITAIEEKKKCPLSKGWRITNGKIISSLLMIVGLVNIFIPASKFLSTLPIIGSSYVLVFVLALFGDLIIINRLSINVAESDNSKCKLKGYNMLIDFFSEKSFIECIYFTIIISIIFFYL
jgi:hypothetical protein